jgi:hypothetical protein
MKFKCGDTVRAIDVPYGISLLKKYGIYTVTRTKREEGIEYLWCNSDKGETGGWRVDRFELYQAKSFCIQLI